MIGRCCGWVRREWKRLLLANVVGMIVQGLLLLSLVGLGLDVIASAVIAKVSSWLLFVVQIIRGGVS